MDKKLLATEHQQTVEVVTGQHESTVKSADFLFVHRLKCKNLTAARWEQDTANLKNTLTMTHLVPSPTPTYKHTHTHTHWHTPIREQLYVCLTHLSEIIQFSGWIRLCVSRAEIKIKILNKQEAHLSPSPTPAVSAPVSASSLFHHILLFLWPSQASLFCHIRLAEDSRVRLCLLQRGSRGAQPLRSQSQSKSVNWGSAQAVRWVLVWDEAPVLHPLFALLFFAGLTGPTSRENKKTCQRHYQQYNSLDCSERERRREAPLSSVPRTVQTQSRLYWTPWARMNWERNMHWPLALVDIIRATKRPKLRPKASTSVNKSVQDKRWSCAPTIHCLTHLIFKLFGGEIWCRHRNAPSTTLEAKQKVCRRHWRMLLNWNKLNVSCVADVSREIKLTWVCFFSF